MKALILAAGLGTRLRPVTLHVPKCLLPIFGKPLLEYHLDSLKKFGVSDVLVNTHYLSEQVEDFLARYGSLNPKLNMVTSYERELLGSAGTLKSNYDFFKDEEYFLVIYADNLTNINYKKLINFHSSRGAICTIAGYYEGHPEQKGMMILTPDNQVTAFKEKPKKDEIVSNYANGGIYVLNKKIFGILSDLDGPLLDFGNHVFPELLKRQEKIYVYLMTEYLLDIGNLESYSLAQSQINKVFKI